MTEVCRQPQLHAFMLHCADRTGRKFRDYAAFEHFTMDEFQTFWDLFLDWSGIIREGGGPVCTGDDCETAIFYPNLRLNYAENVLNRDDDGTALVGCHSDGSYKLVSHRELRTRVIGFAAQLRALGVMPGDRVAAIARNNVEVIIGALATAAIGAVFSSCSHDLGVASILSRFQRIKPKVLLVNRADQPWDGMPALSERVGHIVEKLPTVRHQIDLDQPTGDAPGDFVFERFPFNHPLYILFSSGTTGPPKCIMHGAGGTLIEHIKEHRLHGDLNDADRMLFQTNAGWMMWNWQVSALACGASVVVYDGPLKGPETFWEIVSASRVTTFGTNPAYLQFTAQAGYAPNRLDLSALRSILSTGSILHPQQFDWVTRHVKNVPVQSISGGTDILGCFVLGNPLLPVRRGEAQCRSLGLDTRSLPPGAKIGELVCANPFPSRPLGFFGEDDNRRYHDAYFAANRCVWTHGDLIEFTPHGGAIMHGRSDGVMNIRGVRIGPAEIYRILQQIPSIVEAMAVEQTDESQPGGSRLVLLVVLRSDVALNAQLIHRIRTLLMEQGNATMVPSTIIQMSELPTTHNGKRSEAAARDAVNGRPIRNRVALLNPECLDGLGAKAALPAVDVETMLDNDLESMLCALCKRHFHVPAVGAADNFLMLGGDSLTILGFLMDVLARTRSAIPLHALVGLSTISDLAGVLCAGVPRIAAKSNGTRVRPMQLEDQWQIRRLLNEGFHRRLPWQRIFDHPWQVTDLPRGFVVSDDGVIVGFLGLVGVERSINGRTGRIGNLTSWYVKPQYRAWSNALLLAATRFPGVTYTSLTPSETSYRVLRAMGFSTLDKAKLLSVPLMHCSTLRNGTPQLTFGATADSDAERHIIRSHASYGCAMLTVVEGDQRALIIANRRLHRWNNYALFPYSQVVYCSSRYLFERHLERITRALMRRQRTVGVVFNDRTGLMTCGMKLPSHTLVRPAAFEAADLDNLFSELILLPV